MQKAGASVMAPVDESVRRKQFYWPSTNILVTRFFNNEGIVELQDFMPLRRDTILPGSLYRRVRCVRGNVRFRLECRPAFDYGRQPHQPTLSAEWRPIRFFRPLPLSLLFRAAQTERCRLRLRGVRP